MWILPKQLHTSAYVPDTEALISDLDEQSQICAQSLFLRSKLSLARTWSQKWKRDSWTQHLSGRILKPSHGQSFVTEWTSSLEVIPVSHSVQPERDSERKIQDISGHGSQMELLLCDQESFSSRMSKDTSALDSERSLKIWKDLVTKRRGEYSLRVKSAHLIKESEFLSWPTTNARDWKDTINGTHPPSRPNLSGQTLGQAVSVAFGHHAQDNHSTNGNLPESWATPIQGDSHLASTPEAARRRIAEGKTTLSRQMAAQWATPRANKVHPEITESNRDHLANRNKSNLEEEIAGHCGKATGKLNPRWVETLMGLPIGWTMPSCVMPVTIELTNCDCSEMELFQLPQSEHF